MSARPPPDLRGLELPEEPMQAVERRDVWPSPRGSGFVVVIWLVCGHSQWQRRRAEPRQPPRPVRCTSCWLDVLYRRMANHR